MNEQKIEVGRLEWFYREANPVGITNKLPVLLLHGLPSQSYTWSVILPDLANQGFRAIAPDWIGSGFSAKPERRDFAYTPDAFINALADLVEKLEIERFFLVVQGFLASVGIQYAFRNPDKIARLAIINTPVSTHAKMPWQMQQWGFPLLGDVLTQDPLLIDRTLEGGSRYRIEDQDLDIYRKPFLKSSDVGRSLLATIQNCQFKQSMVEIESGWRTWTKPTLLLWGVNDPWLPWEEAQQTAKSIQNAEFLKIEEAAHYPQAHFPVNVSDALQGFFRRQAG